MRVLSIALIAAAAIVVPISADNTLTPAIDRVLKSIRAADKGQLAVSEEDGRFLRVLVASTSAKHVLEIGGASGYSAIWLGLGARQSGGRCRTIRPARTPAGPAACAAG